MCREVTGVALGAQFNNARIVGPRLQGRTDPDARLNHHFSQLGVKAQLIVRVEKLGVFHQVDARFHGAHHRLFGATVGRGEPMKVMGLMHRGVQFSHRIVSATRDGTGRAAARGHDLDVIRPFMHQPPHRFADLIFAVGHLVAKVEMTASAGNGPPAHLHPRAGDVAALHPFLEDKAHFVAGTMFADGGNTGGQMFAQIHGADQRHHLVAFAEHGGIGATVTGQTQVGVAIDQAGGQTGIAQVDHLAIRRRLLANGGSWADGANAAISDPDGLIRLDRAVAAVKEAGSLDE